MKLSTIPWEDDCVESRTAPDPRLGAVGTDPSEELPARLLLLSWLVQEHLTATAAAFGLTHQQAWALRILDEPRPMGELAGAMRCDASNVTGIVDRLEKRGLVERRVDPDDRRVKRLAVTPAGRALRRRFEERLFSGMPGIEALGEEEGKRLLRLARKMTPDAPC